MSNDLVSIIIPCFQQGRYLLECLNSVKLQSHPNWEAIIVNDGSTDDTEPICKSLATGDSRIRYFFQNNQGVSSARNLGLELAKGNFIQFLDPDDLLDRDKLRHQLEFLMHHDQFDAVYGASLYFSDGDFGNFRSGFDANESKNIHSLGDLALDERPLLNKLLERNIFTICAPLLRRSLVETTGKFDSTFSHHEDWDYFLRAARCGMRIAYRPDHQSDVFIRTHNASLSQNRIAMAESMLKVRLKVHPLLSDSLMRKRNLINMVGLLGAVNPQAVGNFRIHIFEVCNSRWERFFLRLLNLISHDGPLYLLVRIFLPMLPAGMLRMMGISQSAVQALKNTNDQ